MPRILGTGRHLRLVADDAGWEYVERPGVSGICVIVAVTAEGWLLLVEQHRSPVGRRVIELPAGLAGDVAGQEHESLADAARRELLEETGYAAERMEPLASGPPSAGVSSEVVTFFRASGLSRAGAGGGDASESIVVHEVDLPRVPVWLVERQATGLLVDPKVYAGLWFAERS